MVQGTAVQSSLPDGDLPSDEIEIPADDAPSDADVAVEARAREMGWKPLAEWRGPEGAWRPAAEFIARGENILPIVRDQNRRLTERIGKLEGEITSLRATAQEQLQALKEMREMGRTADQRGYERAMKDIKDRQRQAVEAGDTKAFDQLVEQAEALEGSRPAAPAPAPPRPVETTPPAPQLSEPTRKFIADNPWFRNDKLLSDTMVATHQELLNERQANQAVLNADPELDRELLEEAKARVVARYPERFGAASARDAAVTRPASRRAAAVAQPRSAPAVSANAGALTINSIEDPIERAQASEAYGRMKRQMPDYTEAEYMTLYRDPHSDVLALQQKLRKK